MDTDLLRQTLSWLMGAGGGVAAYFLVNLLDPELNLSPRSKRALALTLSAVVSLTAWGVSIWIGYHPQPATTVAALQEAFALVFTAFGLSQIVHMRELKRLT